MRRARVTFKGAYHHIMNRGIRGIDVFSGDELKLDFLRLLREKSKKLKIRLLAYCMMENHYHLILQNSSGKLSEFMKQLNGHYGIIYRKKKGGKGYVFQGRYKSTLIQDGVYLKMSIIYVLLNPVRSGRVESPYDYHWSSINEYYENRDDGLVDSDFVDELFQSRDIINELFSEWAGKELPVRNTRFGKIICDEGFMLGAIKKFDRRRKESDSKRRRKRDYIHKPAELVIKDFEKEKGIILDDIKVNTLEGKKLRSELLVLLKDRAGLRYREIIEFSLFKPLKLSSLGQLYKRAKERIER